MCGNYKQADIIWQLCYAIDRREFYTIYQAKVFSILDLWYGYHQLFLHEDKKLKIAYRSINQKGRTIYIKERV
jgi:hypothetical protein